MRAFAALLIALLAAPVAAQLVPGVGVGIPRLPPVGLPPVDRATEAVNGTVADARALVSARTAEIARIVRANPERIEVDDRGAPAVRGEIVALGVDAAAEAALVGAGFALVERNAIEGLDIAYARFRTPPGRNLARALREARRLARDAEISADVLHFQSGAIADAAQAPAPSARVASGAIGLIDGGVARHPSLTGGVEQRGFARGAPTASAHGTAVASLIAGSGAARGGAPGVSIRAADVYGSDPAGGNATAIARALGWLAASGTRVTAISLVGPPNPLLAAAVAAAQRRGMTIVAAVGNDGPAAPLGYPANYPGVVAVTAVDARMRVLPESGRATRMGFAAPGAGIRAGAPGGGTTTVRGTSYAAPLVAGALARAGSAAALARSAARPSRATGAGIVCAECPTR